jgi:hypothetical protein
MFRFETFSGASPSPAAIPTPSLEDLVLQQRRGHDALAGAWDRKKNAHGPTGVLNSGCSNVTGNVINVTMHAAATDSAGRPPPAPLRPTSAPVFLRRNIRSSGAPPPSPAGPPPPSDDDDALDDDLRRPVFYDSPPPDSPVEGLPVDGWQAPLATLGAVYAARAVVHAGPPALAKPPPADPPARLHAARAAALPSGPQGAKRISALWALQRAGGGPQDDTSRPLQEALLGHFGQWLVEARGLGDRTRCTYTSSVRMLLRLNGLGVHGGNGPHALNDGLYAMLAGSPADGLRHARNALARLLEYLEVLGGYQADDLRVRQARREQAAAAAGRSRGGCRSRGPRMPNAGCADAGCTRGFVLESPCTFEWHVAAHSKECAKIHRQRARAAKKRTGQLADQARQRKLQRRRALYKQRATAARMYNTAAAISAAAAAADAAVGPPPPGHRRRRPR